MASKDFSNKLKDLRLKAGYSQKDVYEYFKIPQSTFSSWEVGKSEPSGEMLIKLCKFYKCDMLKEFSSDGDLNYKEWNIIEKYRFISRNSPDSIDIIDSALDKGYSIAKQISDQQNHIKKLETENQEITEKITLLRIYTYFGRIACAGESFDFSEIPDETIEAPYMEGADFIIGVNGDSMEPDYHDGDRLYVKKTDHMSYGDVGIFTINNECFLKEYGEDGLVSRNKNYKDIAGTEDVRMIGKVIGTLEED